MDSKELGDRRPQMRAMLNMLPPGQRKRTMAAIVRRINGRNRMVWEMVRSAYNHQMAKVAVFQVMEKAKKAIKEGWRDDEPG